MSCWVLCGVYMWHSIELHLAYTNDISIIWTHIISSSNEHTIHNRLFADSLPPWQKEVIFLVALVCLFVCLSVCKQHFSKSYESLQWDFMEWFGDSTRRKWLNGGGNPNLLRWVNEQKLRIVAPGAIPSSRCMWWTRTFEVSISPRPSIHEYIFSVLCNMGVMICFSQGCLRSQSVLSINYSDLYH